MSQKRYALKLSTEMMTVKLLGKCMELSYVYNSVLIVVSDHYLGLVELRMFSVFNSRIL